MSAQNPEPNTGDSLVDIHDPEHNPAATYALEPDYVEALTSQIVSTSGESKPSHSPINLQPLGSVPQSIVTPSSKCRWIG